MRIGIPTFNRSDLLKVCLEKIREQIPDADVLIIDNGGQALEGIVPEGLKVTIRRPRRNLGCSASWNAIMDWAFREHFDSPYVLILNDDIEPDFNAEAIDKWWNDAKCPWLMIGPLGWSAFAISRDCLMHVGYFDDWFWPGGFEEHDYGLRIMLAAPYGQPENPSAPYRAAAGWAPVSRICPELKLTLEHHSSTSQACPALLEQRWMGRVHYEEKWGGVPGAEVWSVPYGDN